MIDKAYEQGYREGFQEGVELMALALACRLGLTIPETLDQVPADLDIASLRQILEAAGIPESRQGSE